MNYSETLEYLNSTPKFSAILGNNNLKKLLEHLGNPQNALKFIHVAGTNGKGSVCAMTARILQESGYKTGLYTSPYIEVFNERIQLNGKNIPENDLAEIATLVRNAIENLDIEISVFAQITAMAFIWFLRKECDIVVLETGLGGTLDATNIITTPVVCAITKIGLDHTQYLGGTISEIAAEKCGIIKDGIPVVTCANQDMEALSIIKSACIRHNSRLIIPDACQQFDLKLMGAYQQYNAQVAASVANQLSISSEIIAKGLKNTTWLARFEFIRENLVIDGGHNPDGFAALADSLRKLKKPIITVFSMMSDKNHAVCAQIIEGVSDKIITTQISMPRCESAAVLAAEFKNPIVEPDPISAVKTALELAGNTHVVCVCGSLYLAGEIRSYFKN
ncbi:MAG: bifunctional folylpolyglutamate synthase/dihydrofolate synthase [Firmicutes bacterium]|nr:bifunctional folylpolyglutamate synthase/dihydrofolate synthase [Bacillota bacterium]